MLEIICTQKRSEELLHGVIGYCGTGEASISCPMFVGNLSSQIIDQFMAYFWLKLKLSTVAELGKA